MKDGDEISTDEGQAKGAVFISYASADRKHALAVCEAMERRGTRCWISCRDVQPGDNYQEAIVRSIRKARAVVLVFSDAANNSDEIKKELSLASRHRVPLIALRIEDVEPNDAFAYELSTRQWIDAFEGWDRSLDSLLARLNQVAAAGGKAEPGATPSAPARRAGILPSRKTFALAASLALVLIAAVAGWLLLRPGAAAAHAMQVRLTGFERLSPDLPSTITGAMREEIIAAFADQGTVAVSTAAAPPPGSAPAYAFGGTVRRDGDKLRVIARLTNERSGTTLWSNSFSYDAAQLDRVPRRIAVDAGNLIRCGLFGASTYREPLPDPVLADYLQFCHNSGLIEWQPTKALDFAHKVVTAVPDFSWGWSAVEIAAIGARARAKSVAEKNVLREKALAAADRAIRLDPENSEALARKSSLLDPADLLGREALLKQALQARALACGCEHHLYAALLEEVGRNAEATDAYRRSMDVLALNETSQGGLWGTLLVAGRTDEAKKHLEAYLDLTGGDPAARARMILLAATLTGDHRSGLAAVRDPALELPAPLKSAIGAAFAALQSGRPEAKAAAAAELLALPADMGRSMKIFLLGWLGENAASLRSVEAAVAAGHPYERSQLFTPALAAARADPAFPGVAQRLGLINYWRKSKTRPDFCSEPDAPPVCRQI